MPEVIASSSPGLLSALPSPAVGETMGNRPLDSSTDNFGGVFRQVLHQEATNGKSETSQGTETKPIVSEADVPQTVIGRIGLTRKAVTTASENKVPVTQIGKPEISVNITNQCNSIVAIAPSTAGQAQPTLSENSSKKDGQTDLDSEKSAKNPLPENLNGVGLMQTGFSEMVLAMNPSMAVNFISANPKPSIVGQVSIAAIQTSESDSSVNLLTTNQETQVPAVNGLQATLQSNTADEVNINLSASVPSGKTLRLVNPTVGKGKSERFSVFQNSTIQTTAMIGESDQLAPITGSLVGREIAKSKDIQTQGSVTKHLTPVESIPTASKTAGDIQPSQKNLNDPSTMLGMAQAMSSGVEKQNSQVVAEHSQPLIAETMVLSGVSEIKGVTKNQMTIDPTKLNSTQFSDLKVAVQTEPVVPAELSKATQKLSENSPDSAAEAVTIPNSPIISLVHSATTAQKKQVEPITLGKDSTTEPEQNVFVAKLTGDNLEPSLLPSTQPKDLAKTFSSILSTQDGALINAKSGFSTAAESNPLIVKSSPLAGEVIEKTTKPALSHEVTTANLKQTPDTSQLSNSPVGQVNSQVIQSKVVETVPPVHKENVLNQIMERAKDLSVTGRNEIEFNLKPDNLGKLKLNLAMENQMITAKFVAESHQVKQIIESSFPQLRQMLQDNGIQIQSLMVSVNQQNSGNGFNQPSQQQTNQGQQNSFAFRNQEDVEGTKTREMPKQSSSSVIDLIA